MRSSYPIAVVFALVLSLLCAVPSTAAGQNHAHSRAHRTAPAAKGKKLTPQASKAPSHARGSAKPGNRKAAGVKPTGKFKTQPASGPSVRGRVRPALRGASRGRARQKTWPKLAANGRPGRIESVHLAIPPPLRGSHESLVHQNAMAEADGLERILDDADLNDRIAHGSLVPVPASPALSVNANLPENRRYCRPWTAKFLTDLAAAHSARFSGAALEVTSAVRTVEYQRQLRHINGNAAAADGDVASPHLTGGTIDIAKAGMTAREIGWLRAWLLPLEQKGKIDVEEEFRQSCFHISVYKSYTEPTPQKLASPLAAASMMATPGR